MKSRQYGVFVSNYERVSKEVTPIILVFYEIGQAKEIDKEFRDLGCIPQYNLYLEKVRELREICKVRVIDVSKDNIIREKSKIIYSDDTIGRLELVNKVPIKIEGWFLVGGGLSK